jgi:hypothetical protein
MKNKRKKGVRIVRWPRLLKDEEALIIQELLVGNVELRVCARSEQPAMEFTFRVEVPKTTIRWFPEVIYMFYTEGGDERFAQCLTTAFMGSKYGTKPFMKLMSLLFDMTYVGAIGIWQKESRRFLKSGDEKKIQIQAHAKRKKRSAQHQLLLALTVEERVRLLRPALEEISRGVRTNSYRDTHALNAAVSEHFETEIFKRALLAVPNANRNKPFRILEYPSAPVVRILEAYLEMEVPGLKFGSGRPSLRKLLQIAQQARTATEGLLNRNSPGHRLVPHSP